MTQRFTLASICLSVLVPVLLLACSLSAQEFEEPTRGLDGGTQSHVTGIVVLPLTGKPFSARSTTEWTRTLEDGTVVSTHLFAMIARDTQGRNYRERRSFVPSDSAKESRLNEIIVMDPLNHTRTTCIVASRLCSVADYYASATFTLSAPGPIGDGTRFLSRESLGNDVIEGMNVIGTRETISINSGVVGNNQPLVSARDFWYYPELQINLAVTRKDPRQGTQVIRIGKVNSAEPDAAMFTIPAGFYIDRGGKITTNTAGANGAIRISPGVAQGLVLSHPAPVYPDVAKRIRVQGLVVLETAIDKSGATKIVSVVSSPNPALTDAAIAAVSQWRYKPYLVNGSAVDVETLITVSFSLQPASPKP